MRRHPPPHPASGLLPRPEGQGAVVAIPGGPYPHTLDLGTSPRGEGQTGGAKSPLPCLSGFNALASPTPPGLRPPPPPPQGAGAVRGDSPGQTLSGHDELLVRTGRTLADCPPTRITTVFRGGGRLTADWAILPQNSLRLLNWAVSSWISIPNVNAYGGLPPPHTSRTRGCLPVANPGISSWNIQVQCSSSSPTRTWRPQRAGCRTGVFHQYSNTLRTRQPVTHLRAGPGICTGSPL